MQKNKMDTITYENFIERVSELFPEYLQTEFYKNTDHQLNYIFFSDFMRYIINVINKSEDIEKNFEVKKSFDLINCMIEKKDKLENLAVVEGIEWLVQEKKSKSVAEKLLSTKGKEWMKEVLKTTGIKN